MSRTLYLIDGHAQIFRSYFAIRGGMTSPVTGEPTHAVFAFAGMLIKFFQQCQPQFALMCVDAEGPTFRDEIFEDYKANREAPPDDFAPQVQRIFEMTRLFGIGIEEHAGAEADDVIATITRQVLDDPDLADVDIKIVSKDKDLQQLLGERVSLFDIHTDATIDAEKLWEEKGITPDQVIDLLTLTGDTVDNIPGVTGIGPKTAAKLLQEHGSVANLVANLDQIKGKRRQNIEQAQPFFDIARKLVTLRDDLDVAFHLDDARLGEIKGDALQKLFSDLGFNRHRRDLNKLLGRDESSGNGNASTQTQGELFATTPSDTGNDGTSDVQDPAAAGLSTAADARYECLTSLAQLDDLVATLKQQPRFTLDTETIGMGSRVQLCGLCFAWQSGHGVYVPTRSPEPENHADEATVLQKLRPVLEDPAVGKIGHNFKYDLRVLHHAGINVRGTAFDTMVAAFLLNLPGLGMDALARGQLNHHTIPIRELIGEDAGRGRAKVAEKTMDQVPLSLVTPYAAEDADITWRLYESFEPRLRELELIELAEHTEMPLVEVLAAMEEAGIKLDPAVLEEQKQELAQRIDELKTQIHEAAGRTVNLNSPKQLAELLFTELKFPVVKRTKTGPSTDQEVLERLAEPEQRPEHLPEEQARIPALIVQYRELAKLVSTYLDKLADSVDPLTNRVHANFHQTQTATGRLSSSDPNLQNIPIRTEVGRRIRKAFIAEPEHRLICADYSQIELRVLAHLSEDPALIAAFRDNQDIHTAVAAQVFHVEPDQVSREQRGHAKTINFGIVYGVTAYGLARRIEDLDVEAAKKLIADYKARFAGIDRFLAACIDHAQTHGYVKTILGRRRYIPELQSKQVQTRQLGERLAINTVVQGSAADLIKQAMIRLHRRIESEALPMRMLLQIHDELVMESPASDAAAMASVLEAEMTQAMELQVPLVVEASIAENWFDAKG